MTAQKSFIEIANEADHRKYWTQIPNILWFFDLSNADFKLYNTFVKTCGWDQGKTCFKSTRTLAAEAGLSFGQVSSSKDSLLKAGLIIRTTKKRTAKGWPVDHIKLVDIWPVNMAFFAIHKSSETHLRFVSLDDVRQHLSKCSVTEHLEAKCSVTERKCSVTETEEEPLKKNQKKEEEAAAPKQNPEHPFLIPEQLDWTPQDHESFDVVLRSWADEFGKMTAQQVEKMITLWNLYPEEEIHEYAWNEMAEARDKRKVRPNLAYYQRCLETEARANWVLEEGENGHGKP